MVLSKEIRSNLKEHYEKAKKLITEDSKNDPTSEPYRSHYASRDILEDMRNDLKTKLSTIESDEPNNIEDALTYKIILAYVCRDLGRICIFTEETSNGENYLNESIEVIGEKILTSGGVIPYISVMNEFGLLHANRSEYQKALEYLTKAEECYKNFKNTKLNTHTITDVFNNYEDMNVETGLTELESMYTYCTFYLAQVQGHLGEVDKSAALCHLTLKRQLKAGSYDPIDFALNAAALSQYYIGQFLFKEARHHLAAATLIMNNYETKMIKPGMTDQQIIEVKETFKHRFADVARCWSKYGLNLLVVSKDRLYSDEEDKLAAALKNISTDPDSYRFPNLDVTEYETRVTADFCLTFDDAKDVYHVVIKWLDEAKEYYKADSEATEYAKIIKDYAELYQHIAFFEDDPNNQCKMHKRRAKYYEELLELLNPEYYMSICRESWYGAGLAYCSMIDIKLDLFKEKSNPSAQEMHKFNQLCTSAIKHFKEFIKTYMEKDEITIRAHVDDEEKRSVIYSHFHVGRLYYKLMSSDTKVQLLNSSNSLQYYQRFTDLCKTHSTIADTLKAEVGVCSEMSSLLPLKIETLRRRLPSTN